MKARARAKWILVTTAAAAVVVAMWRLSQPPVRPAPKRPFGEHTQCDRGPYRVALVDADHDDYPDLAILCGSELLVVSGVDGDVVWGVDAPGDFDRYPGLGPFLETDGPENVILAFGRTIFSIDASTGSVRWSTQRSESISTLEVGRGCVMVDRHHGERATLSVETGEPSSCTVPPRPSTGPSVWTESGDRHGFVATFGVDLRRRWSVPCGPGLGDALLTPTGLLVWSSDGERPPARFARIHDVASTRVTRVLETGGARWGFRSLPPYLVGWRRPDPEDGDRAASPRDRRPVLEVFDATSLTSIWRSDPEEPPAVWQHAETRADHAYAVYEEAITPEVAECLPDDGPVYTPAPPPDVPSELDYYQACKAKPRGELSAYEKCIVDSVSSDCSAAEDCLVTCIAIGWGRFFGGGCAHVCFRGRHSWADRPSAVDECEDVEN